MLCTQKEHVEFRLRLKKYEVLKDSFLFIRFNYVLFSFEIFFCFLKDGPNGTYKMLKETSHEMCDHFGYYPRIQARSSTYACGFHTPMYYRVKNCPSACANLFLLCSDLKNCPLLLPAPLCSSQL